MNATSTIATLEYDGLGRRISKAVTNSADWTATYHYYYDGYRMIETHDGSADVLKQHVWGPGAPGYVDELVQIGINDDPTDAGEDDCETYYYAMHVANFNVLGLADSSGDLVERYEYSPYGQRTIYKYSGSNDALCSAPLLESQRVEISGEPAAYSLCDIGHQGLMHDKEFTLIYNRARYLHPRLERFLQRDPKGYVDGMNLYECAQGNRLRYRDPSGLKIDHYECCTEPQKTAIKAAHDAAQTKLQTIKAAIDMYTYDWVLANYVLKKGTKTGGCGSMMSRRSGRIIVVACRSPSLRCRTSSVLA